MKRIVAAVLLLSLIWLTGCLEPVQVDAYGYVLSVGIDKGKHRLYEFSFLLQDTGVSGGEGAEQESASMLLGAEGDTIFEAIATMVSGLPYELNLTRTNYVVFSDAVVAAGDIQDMILTSLSALRIRPSVKLMVVMGCARDFQAGLKVRNSPNLTKIQYSMIQNYYQEGNMPLINYTNFTEAIQTQRYDPVLTLCYLNGSIPTDEGKDAKESPQPTPTATPYTEGLLRYGGMESYTVGAALFDGSYMVGVLSGEQSKFLLMGRGELHNANFTYTDPAGMKYALRIGQWKRPDMEIDTGERPCARVSVYLNCHIDRGGGVQTTQLWEQGLHDAVRAYFQEQLMDVFTVCRALNSDAFGFGRAASMRFASRSAWEDYAWKEKYPALRAEFDVNIRLYGENVLGAME